MNKYVILFSVFGLTGCAYFNPGVCDRTLADRYPECSDPEVSENLNERRLGHRGSPKPWIPMCC